MNFKSLPILLAVSLLAFAGCKREAPPAVVPSIFQIDPLRGHLLHAQDRLPTMKLKIGERELVAEVARQPVEIATGMMFRTNMADGEAMLFVFNDAAPRSFYMRNCFIPLSGAYITPNGEIFQIIQMRPHDETGIPSHSDNIQFVLEVPQGWFKRNNINVGDVIRTEKGSLRETFFGTDKSE